MYQLYWFSRAVLLDYLNCTKILSVFPAVLIVLLGIMLGALKAKHHIAKTV